MAIQILKSQLGDRNFQAEVEAYRAGVIEARETPGMSPPLAGPFVEQALRRERQAKGPDELIIDYEIIDDTPPPPTPEERKIAAINASRAQEQAEIDALLPPLGMRRLAEMEYSKAMRSVHEARMKGQEPSAEAQKIVDDYAALQDRIAEIQYEGAKREAKIEEGE